MLGFRAFFFGGNAGHRSYLLGKAPNTEITFILTGFCFVSLVLWWVLDFMYVVLYVAENIPCVSVVEFKILTVKKCKKKSDK